jgi:hypothetical protein
VRQRFKLLGALLSFFAVAVTADPEFTNDELNAVGAASPSNDEFKKARHDQHEVWLEKNYDPGVIDRLLVDYYGHFNFSSWLKLGVIVALSPFEQGEPELIGGELNIPVEKLGAVLTLAVQQERWHAWQITENRTEAYLNFKLFPTLYFAFGLGYRAPQFNVNSLAQSLNIFSDNSEVNVIYRLQWDVVNADGFLLSFLISNYDRFRLYTFTDIHFALAPELRLNSQFSLAGYGAIGVKGVSGVVLSFSQITFGAGLKYEL